MIKYSVKVSPIVRKQLRGYLKYIKEDKGNPIAAKAVADDYRETLHSLEYSAGSMRLCDDDDLANEGLRRVFFHHHDYVLIYEVDENERIARIHAVYHTLQDYESIFKSERE